MNLGLFAPELVLVITAILVILIDLFVDRKSLLAVVGIIGLIVSAGYTISLWGTSTVIFNGMLTVDSFSLFFAMLFAVIAALVILASQDFVSRFKNFSGEYYALVLISALGMMLMAASRELITIYISLELTSISLYILSGFLKDKKSSEASLKYLLLGAVASAIFLFGLSLIYGFTGYTEISHVAAAIAGVTSSTVSANPALILGVVMLITGFGFKIAAIPFQLWVPDVYEGAPTPVVAFLSVGSKAAGFALLLRVFSSAFGLSDWLTVSWGVVFAVLAALGMFIGNISAIPQKNIKRMMGYSSIAQAGYLMVGLAAMGLAGPGTSIGQSGVIFFLAGYAFANLGAFSVIIAISNKIGSDEINDYAGMIKRAPVLALAMSFCLISLIGMPPAAGFMAKFYIFNSAIQTGDFWMVVLVIIAVFNSVISAFYYLRVVKVMWFGEPASEEKVPSSAALKIGVAVSCLGVLLIGIIPGYVIYWAQLAAHMFGN